MKRIGQWVMLMIGLSPWCGAIAQDITEGKILALDRVAKILVMSDKSVFPLEKMVGDVPEGLNAGDRIEITYDSNEDDGVTAIYKIKKK